MYLLKDLEEERNTISDHICRLPEDTNVLRVNAARAIRNAQAGML